MGLNVLDYRSHLLINSATLPFCVWPLRIFPSLPGSRFSNFYRDVSSALFSTSSTDVGLNFIYLRFPFYVKKTEKKSCLTRIELTTSGLSNRPFGRRSIVIVPRLGEKRLFANVAEKSSRATIGSGGDGVISQRSMSKPFDLRASSEDGEALQEEKPRGLPTSTSNTGKTSSASCHLRRASEPWWKGNGKHRGLHVISDEGKTGKLRHARPISLCVSRLWLLYKHSGAPVGQCFEFVRTDNCSFYSICATYSSNYCVVLVRCFITLRALLYV